MQQNKPKTDTKNDFARILRAHSVVFVYVWFVCVRTVEGHKKRAQSYAAPLG